MAPTIVILCSPFVLREKTSAKKLICAAVAVIGMVFVSGIIESGISRIDEVKGILFGLAAAALYATVVMMNKRMSGIDAYEKTIIQLISAGVVMIPYLLITEDFSAIQLVPKDIVFMAIVGIVHTGIAYALYFGSMDHLKAQTVAILSYIDPITALFLSAMILHEKLSVFGMIGAALILGAAAVSELKVKIQKD